MNQVLSIFSYRVFGVQILLKVSGQLTSVEYFTVYSLLKKSTSALQLATFAFSLVYVWRGGSYADVGLQFESHVSLVHFQSAWISLLQYPQKNPCLAIKGEVEAKSI